MYGKDEKTEAEAFAIHGNRKKHVHAVAACLLILIAFAICIVGGCTAYSGNTGGGVTVIHTQGGETVSRLASEERTICDVVDEVADSVVEINCTMVKTQYDWFGRPITTSGTSAGSGVIIADNGTIITNHHVIDGASDITIRLRNGTEHTATLVGSDSEHDLAIIRFTPDEGETLTVATFGESSKLKVGQPVVVIGNPLGTLGGTVTDGIISALDRDITVEGTKMRLLQTNASINSGNSGGGMFDLDGRLVGIVNAKSSGMGIEGLGFAIPADTAVAVAEQILNK